MASVCAVLSSIRFSFRCFSKLLAIACDARHILLPLLAESQHQEIAHERLVLSEGDRFPTAPARDVLEAFLHLLVEVGQRRDGLQLVPVEPAMELALVLLVEPQTHVDGADDASLRLPLRHQVAQRRHVLVVGWRAAHQDDHLLGVRAPLELLHGALEAVLHRLLPVAAAFGDDAVEEILHLASLEGQVGPLDEEVLALTRGGRRLAVVAVAVGDGADPRRRDESLHGEDQVVEPMLDLVDDVLHAPRRVDDDGDVEADLAEAADVFPEGAVERDAEAAEAEAAASAAAHAETAGARTGRGEARAQVGAGAERRHRARELNHGARAHGLRLHRLREDDGVGRPGDHQILHFLIVLRVLRPDQLGDVLQRVDLASLLLSQTRATAGADAEPGPDAEPEATADSHHVEQDHQQQYGVDDRGDAHEGESAARVRARSGIENRLVGHETEGDSGTYESGVMLSRSPTPSPRATSGGALAALEPACG